MYIETKLYMYLNKELKMGLCGVYKRWYLCVCVCIYMRLWGYNLQRLEK